MGDTVPVEQQFYRGYRISLFGGGSAWSFKLAPTKVDLPLLKRTIFLNAADAKPCALTVAKIEIDRLWGAKSRKD